MGSSGGKGGAGFWKSNKYKYGSFHKRYITQNVRPENGDNLL